MDGTRSTRKQCTIGPKKFKKQKLAFIYIISKVKLIDNKCYMCFELSQAQFEKS